MRAPRGIAKQITTTTERVIVWVYTYANIREMLKVPADATIVVVGTNGNSRFKLEGEDTIEVTFTEVKS